LVSDRHEDLARLIRDLGDRGLYIDVLTDLGVRLRLLHAHREPIPAVTDYDVLMIGGTPDASYRRAEFPYLSAVYDVICQAVRVVEVLSVLDECTRERPALGAERSMRSEENLEALDDLLMGCGIPEHMRIKNSPDIAVGNPRATSSYSKCVS
jgi:hypothetical protein